MLSYLQFLFESHFEHIKDQHGSFYIHKKNFGHHEVGISFSHEPHKHTHGHYDVGYDVNGEMDRHEAGVHGLDSGASHKILHHIHKTINHFIREKKPKALRLEPSDSDHHSQEKKTHVYGKLVHHLAKHHGGEVHGPDKHGAMSVHFPRH